MKKTEERVMAKVTKIPFCKFAKKEQRYLTDREQELRRNQNGKFGSTH